MIKYRELNYDKRYIDYNLLMQINKSFQVEYQNWWEENIKLGDIFNFHTIEQEDCEEGTINHPIYRDCEINQIRCVKEDNLGKNKEVFMDFVGDEILGLPTITTLKEFIKYKTNLTIQETPYKNDCGVYGININLWNLEMKVVYKCFDGLSTNSLLAYLEVAEGLCENK